mmetsp:Transcript_134672/g.233982  ORF Transcript_134672/g.233982 Transcript_134672/m.233982 type:complete len:140 (+) Transcript_134672:1923-2342(+)
MLVLAQVVQRLWALEVCQRLSAVLQVSTLLEPEWDPDLMQAEVELKLSAAEVEGSLKRKVAQLPPNVLAPKASPSQVALIQLSSQVVLMQQPGQVVLLMQLPKQQLSLAASRTSSLPHKHICLAWRLQSAVAATGSRSR